MLFFFAVLDRLNILQPHDKIRCCAVEVNFFQIKPPWLRHDKKVLIFDFMIFVCN